MTNDERVKKIYPFWRGPIMVTQNYQLDGVVVFVPDDFGKFSPILNENGVTDVMSNTEVYERGRA